MVIARRSRPRLPWPVGVVTGIVLLAGCDAGETSMSGEGPEIASERDGTPTPWSLVRVVAPEADRFRVEAVVGSSTCSELRDVVVVEDATRVEVAVSSGSIEGLEEGADCSMDSAHEVVEIELDAPLGERELVGCLPLDDEDWCDRVDRQRLDPAVRQFGGDGVPPG